MSAHHWRVAAVHVAGVLTVITAAQVYRGAWVLTPAETELVVAFLATCTGIGSAWVLTHPPVHNRKGDDQ